MPYSRLPDRSSGELNSAADINQLSENIAVVKDNIDGQITSRIAALEAHKHSPVRQTVLTGPVDSNGRADFIESASGLNARTKNITDVLPLIMSYGNGFDSHGQYDLIAVLEENMNWNSLPASSTIYLYLDYDPSTGSITSGFTTLFPEYSYIKPSSPSSGQYWYPMDHRCSGEYYNGSSWVPVIRIFVGEAVTDGSSVTIVRSYAYQGFYRSDIITIAPTTTYSFSHNLGCLDYFFDQNTRQNSSHAWSRQTRYYPNAYYGYAKIQYSRVTARMAHGGVATATGAPGVNGTEAFTTTAPSTAEAYVVVKRAW